MGRPCVACNHPQSREINELLASGGSFLAVERQFGVDRQAASRHLHNGHVPPPVGEPATRGGERRADPEAQRDARAQITAVVEELDAQDPASMSQLTRIAWWREKRLAAESLAKIAPVSHGSASVEDLDGYRELIEAVIAVTWPKPGDDSRMRAARSQLGVEIAAALAKFESPAGAGDQPTS